LASTKEKQVLVLCVDLDDDIGQKTGVASPIVGRDNVLSAGIKLSLADPEESDANAIFASIRVFDRIRSQGLNGQIAVVTGSADGEPFASSKIMSEISKITEGSTPTDVYVVTDGFGDEDVMPVMQSKLPLSGVVRVVVKHSRSVEESYVVIGRYLKMLIADERFKKYSLGLTGFSILLFSVFALANLLDRAITVFTLLLGILMLVKGFNLDVRAKHLMRSIFMLPLPTPLFALRVGSFLVGYGLLLTGLIVGGFGAYDTLQKHNVPFEQILFNLNLGFGGFLKSASIYLLASAIFIQLARIVSFFLGDFAESRNTMISIAVMASLYPMAMWMGDFLISPSLFLQALLNAALTSLALSIVSVLAITGIYRVVWARRREQES